MPKQKKFRAKTEKIALLGDFLERFKKINQSLLLEIYEDSFVSKTHTPDRGFIKRSKMPFDGFCEFEEDRSGKVIKVPFFNIQRVMKNIDLLPNGEVFVDFYCDESNNYFICRELKFVTKSLTISNKCTELDYVVSLSDEVYERVIKSSTAGATVDLPKQSLSKVHSLSDSDTEETISIRIDSEGLGIRFFGPMYDYLIETKVSGEMDKNIKVKKSFFQYVADSADIRLGIYEDKITISSSQDGMETTAIIGTTENE